MQIISKSGFIYTADKWLNWDQFDRIVPLYFHPDTVKFHNSKRSDYPVYSEKLLAWVWVQSDRAPLNARVYSVRSIDHNARITVIARFESLKQAKKHLKGLINV